MTSLKDKNPFSQIIFSGEPSATKLLMLLYKLGLSIYPIIDQNH